jgi:hypothetical protein
VSFKKMFGGAAGGVLGCLGALLGVGLLITVLAVACTSTSPDAPEIDLPRQTSAAPAPDTDADADPVADTYPNGDYVVGKDIPPGEYQTSGAQSGLFEYCDVQTDGNGPGGDGFGQWKNAGAPGERIIITLTEADGTLSINGCEPLEAR